MAKENAEEVKCSLVFVSAKEAILSNKRHACFDSEKSWRPRSVFISWLQELVNDLLYATLVKGSSLAFLLPMWSTLV